MGINRVDRPMLIGRKLVEDHIASYGMVPHPDKLKEAIADAIHKTLLHESAYWIDDE